LEIFHADQKALKLLRLRLFFVLSTLIFICGIIFVFSKPAAAAAVCLFFSAGAFLYFFYFPRLIRGYEIQIREKDVLVLRGVFNRQILILPQKRLLYTEEFVSPLMKRAGLRSVCFNAARGKIRVPFLKESDSKAIIEMIRE
jgi:membrane protein YdbS with pleckstrin-like domain